MPVNITVGHSSKDFQAGDCAGMLVPGTAASLRVQVGQMLTLHINERGMAIAISSDPKVLVLTSQRPLDEQFRALSPGASQITYSPSIEACNYESTTAETPCLIANVKVAV